MQLQNLNRSFRKLKLPFEHPFTNDYVFPKEKDQSIDAKYADHYGERHLINPSLIDWAKNIGLGVLRIERFSSKPNYRMYVHTDNDDWIDNIVKIIWCYCPTNDHSMVWYDVKDPSWYDTITTNDSGPTMKFPDFNLKKEIARHTILPNEPILANTGQPHNIENGSNYRHVVCAWFYKLNSNESINVDGLTYPKPLEWDDALNSMKNFIINDELNVDDANQII